MVTKQETIEELCGVATKVNDKVFDYSLATDCFCTKEESSDYRFEERVLEFIKEAVNEKIDREVRS